MKVSEDTVVRVIWSRGKKAAKTQFKTLREDSSVALFDEKFRINTILDLDEEGKPLKPKLSKMTVCLDKSKGGHSICEAEFNMADFDFG